MKKLKFIEISPSFYFIIILCVIFRVVDYFLYSVLFVFLHELAHIVVAKRYGLRIKKITISPLGQIAHIENIEKQSLHKRINISIAGIVLNLIIFGFSLIYTSDKMQLIGKINLSIAFFNCLPIYPLDGGRIILYLLGYFIGDLKASIIINKIGKTLSYFIFFMGFIQIILYPYNISLLCLGFYFVKNSKNQYLYYFYKLIKNKQNYEKDKILKIRNVLVDKNFLIKDIVLILSIDYYIIINVANYGKIGFCIEEKNLLEYIQNYGLNGKIYDIYVKLKNKNIFMEEKYDR